MWNGMPWIKAIDKGNKNITIYTLSMKDERSVLSLCKNIKSLICPFEIAYAFGCLLICSGAHN